MCKFTNRLFVFFLLLEALALAKPIIDRPVSARGSDLLEFLYNDYNDYGYQEEEVHYDQRQKGEENLQLHLNGFLIGVPARENAHWLDILAEEYLNNALLLEKSKKHLPTEPTSSYPAESTTLPETAVATIINIPASKKDIESRQHVNDDVSTGNRTKSHILQLLQMFRRTHA